MFSTLEAQGQHGSSKRLCAGNPSAFDNVVPKGPCSEEKRQLAATYVNSETPPSLQVSQVRVKRGLRPGDEQNQVHKFAVRWLRGGGSGNHLFFEGI